MHQTRLSFNRTSLELKRGCVEAPECERRLLIEPVWNWNTQQAFQNAGTAILLIEPVWNWNFTLIRHSVDRVQLLIEPVWNWNKYCCRVKPNIHFPFNRTSLELKLRLSAVCVRLLILLIEPVWNWNRFASGKFCVYLCLLIEPVWNWNTRVVDIEITVATAFNRTSLELKQEWGTRTAARAYHF